MPSCGTDPVVLNAVFETGFDLPFKLSEEFTKQFPNVTWKISQDQFANLISTTPRLLAGDNPPDLIRLPTMVSLVKDNLLKNLDDYVTAFGWDKWPAAQLAQNRVGTDGTRGAGSLYAAGLNYSLTGVFYNKKLATQIGMTAAAEDRRRVRGPPRQGEGGQPPADHAVERRRQRRRTGLPASAAHGRLRRDDADQRLDLPEVRAPRSTRRPTSPPPSICSSGSRRATSRRTRTPSSTPMPTPGSARARACSCSTATGRTPSTTRTSPATSASSSSRPATDGGPVAAMSAPLTYGIAANAKNADCAAAFFNWVATNDDARQVDVTVGGSNPGGPTDLAIPPAAAGSITNDTLAAGGDVAKANGAMDFIANATGHDLRPGLDAGAAEDGRRQADAGRPAQGRPGRVRKGTRPVTYAADRCVG